jgi:hypothetical protein
MLHILIKLMNMKGPRYAASMAGMTISYKTLTKGSERKKVGGKSRGKWE